MKASFNRTLAFYGSLTASLQVEGLGDRSDLSLWYPISEGVSAYSADKLAQMTIEGDMRLHELILAGRADVAVLR